MILSGVNDFIIGNENLKKLYQSTTASDIVSSGYHKLEPETEKLNELVNPTFCSHKPGEGVLNAASDFTYREYANSRLFSDDFGNYIKNGEL